MNMNTAVTVQSNPTSLCWSTRGRQASDTPIWLLVPANSITKKGLVLTMPLGKACRHHHAAITAKKSGPHSKTMSGHLTPVGFIAFSGKKDAESFGSCGGRLHGIVFPAVATHDVNVPWTLGGTTGIGIEVNSNIMVPSHRRGFALPGVTAVVSFVRTCA